MKRSAESRHSHPWRRRIKQTIPLLLCFLLPHCAKKTTISDFAIRKAHIPLFIGMPNNPLVFDNFSPVLYQGLHHHFLRIGYDLVNSSRDGYTLRIQIKKLEPSQKFVSQDVVLMHSVINCQLECTLLDFNKHNVAGKTFFFSALLSRSKNPILNSDFTDFEYKRLSERAAPKIERFFRPYLLKAFTQ